MDSVNRVCVGITTTLIRVIETTFRLPEAGKHIPLSNAHERFAYLSEWCEWERAQDVKDMARAYARERIILWCMGVGFISCGTIGWVLGA